MNPIFRFGLAVMMCATFAGQAANIMVDTTPYWLNSQGVDTLGETANETCGQSFTVPAGAGSMLSFAFWLSPRMNPGAVDFTANLVGWDGTKPTGPLLYTSAPVTTSGSGNLAYQKVQFQLPNVSVQAGQQYMAFFTTVGVPDGPAVGSAYVGLVPGDVLQGGRAWVNYIYTSIPDILQTGWAYIQPSTDYAFQAEFASVPEPGACALIGWCLASLIFFKKRLRT